jgi:hypothetical protein
MRRAQFGRHRFKDFWRLPGYTRFYDHGLVQPTGEKCQDCIAPVTPRLSRIPGAATTLLPWGVWWRAFHALHEQILSVLNDYII